MRDEDENSEVHPEGNKIKESEHILKIFNELKESIKKNDVLKIRDLSNHTIHAASTIQDANSIAIAVIIYAIGKILERQDYKSKPGWEKFYTNVLLEVDIVIDSLKKGDEKSFSKSLTKLRTRLGNVSGSLKKYIQDVFNKASINKASRIYEHGISLGKTSKLLGITLWELSNYAGQTGIADVKLGHTGEVRDRINLVEELFA